MVLDINQIFEKKKYIFKVIFFILCLFPFFSGIKTIPPLDRDEARYMQSSYQMVEDDDYVNIKFLDEIRAKKPIGIYWLQSFSIKLFGENDIVSYRYVSIFGAFITILMIWFFSKNLYGSKEAFLITCLSITNLLFLFEAHIAKTDSFLLGLICVQQFCLFKIILNQKNNFINNIIPILMWIVISFGILIKGPISVIILILTILSFSTLTRDFSILKKIKPIWGIIILLFIISPWIIMIQEQTGGIFLQKAFQKDFLPKLLGAHESHGGYPGYYILLSLLIFWPLATFIPITIIFVKNNFSNVNVKFLLSWFIPFWIIIELVPTKLFHYPLPIIPPLVLLISGGLIYINKNKLNFVNKTTRNLTFIFSCIFSMGNIILGCIFIYLIINYSNSKNELLAYGISLFIIFLIILYLSILINFNKIFNKNYTFIKKIDPKYFLIFLSSLSYIIIFSKIIPNLHQLFPSESIYKQLKKIDYDNISIVGYHEPSLVFNLKGKLILSNYNESVIFLAEEKNNVVLIEDRSLKNFLSSASDLNVKLNKFNEIEGFNYSKGQNIKIYFFKVAK